MDYDEIVELTEMVEEERTRFASVIPIKRSSRAASRLRRTDMSGCGPILAVLTSEAERSYPRSSIPCIGDMKTRKYAIRTSLTSPIHGFPLRVMMRGILPISMGGQSGSRMGGGYKS